MTPSYDCYICILAVSRAKKTSRLGKDAGHLLWCSSDLTPPQDNRVTRMYHQNLAEANTSFDAYPAPLLDSFASVPSALGRIVFVFYLSFQVP